MAPSRRSQRTEPPAANTRSSRRVSQQTAAGSTTPAVRTRMSTPAPAAKSSAKPKPLRKATSASTDKSRRQQKPGKTKPELQSAEEAQSESEDEDDDESASGDDSGQDSNQTNSENKRSTNDDLVALTHEVVDDEEEAAGFVRRSTRRRVSSDMPLALTSTMPPVSIKKVKDKESVDNNARKAAVPNNAGVGNSASSRGAARSGSAASSSSLNDKDEALTSLPSTRSSRLKSSSASISGVVLKASTVQSLPFQRVHGKAKARPSVSSQLASGEDGVDMNVDVEVPDGSCGPHSRGSTPGTDFSFARPALLSTSLEATVTYNGTPIPGTIPTGASSAATQCAMEPNSSAAIRPKPKGIKRVGKRRRPEEGGSMPGTSATSASSSDRDATATPPLLRSSLPRSTSASHSPVIFGTPRNSVQGLVARYGHSAMNVSMDGDLPADSPAAAATTFVQHYQQYRHHPHVASPDSAMDLTSPVHYSRSTHPAQYPHSLALGTWNAAGSYPLSDRASSPTSRDQFDDRRVGSQHPRSSLAFAGAPLNGADDVDGPPQKRARTESLPPLSPNGKLASQTVEEAAAALLMISSATPVVTRSEADVSPTTAASDLSGPPANGPFSPPLDHHDMSTHDHHHHPNHNSFGSSWEPHSPTSTMFTMPPPPPPPSTAAHSPEVAYPMQSQAFPSITTGWPSISMPSMGPTPPPTATFDSSGPVPTSPPYYPFMYAHPHTRRMSIDSMTSCNPGLAPPLYRRTSMDSTAVAVAGAGAGMGGYYTDEEDNMLISPVMRTVELRSPSPFTGMSNGSGTHQALCSNSHNQGTGIASGANSQAAQSPTYAPFFTNGMPMDAARIAAVIDAVRRPHTAQATLPASGVQTWAQLFQRQPGAAAAPNASAAAALVSAQPPASMAAVLANLDVIPEEGTVPFTLEQLNAMAAGGLDAFNSGLPGIAPAAAGGGVSSDGTRQSDGSLSGSSSAASTPTMSRQRPTILAQTPAPMVHHAPELLREYAKQMADQYQLARTVADPVTARAIMLHIVLADPQRPTTLPELINAFPHVDPLTVVHTCETLADRPYAVVRELSVPEFSRVRDRLIKQAPVSQTFADVSKLQVVSLCKVAGIRGKGYRLDESYGLMVKRDGTASSTAATAASASGSGPRRVPTGYTNSPGGSRGQLTIPTSLLSCTTKGRRRFLRYKDGHTFVHGYELPAVVVAHTRSGTESTPGTVAPGVSAAAASAAPSASPTTAAQSNEEPSVAAFAAAPTQSSEAAMTASLDEQASGPSLESSAEQLTTSPPAAGASAGGSATAPSHASSGTPQSQPDSQQSLTADDAALGLPVAPSPGMYTPTVKERYLNAVTSARWTGRPADALKMLINLGPDARLSHRDVIARFGSEISLSTLTVALMYSWARPLLPVEEIPREAKPDLWDAMVAHVPQGADISKMRLYLSIGLECEGLEQPWADCVVPTVNDRKYYLREWYVLVEGPQLVYADGTAPTVAEIPGGAASSSASAAAGSAAVTGSAKGVATSSSRNKSSGSKKSGLSNSGSKSSAGASVSKSASVSASALNAPRPTPAATTLTTSRPPSAAGSARALTSSASNAARPVPPQAPTAAGVVPASTAALVAGPRPTTPSTAGSRLLNAVASARLPAPSAPLSRNH